MMMDPRHIIDVMRRYDIEKGYALHRWYSLDLARDGQARPLDGLGANGWEVCCALSAETAAELASCAGEKAREIGRDRLRAVLTEAFASPLGSKLRDYYLSEFAVLFANLASDELTDSCRWHCDAGPLEHLKLLVYLTDSDGGTEVIDRAATYLFQRVGYGFGPKPDRLDDLGPLGAQYGIGFTPNHIMPRMGEALVFEPTRVLHKGVPGVARKRRLLQVGIVPWPQPWDTAFDTIWDFIAINEGAGFPTMRAEAA